MILKHYKFTTHQRDKYLYTSALRICVSIWYKNKWKVQKLNRLFIVYCTAEEGSCPYCFLDAKPFFNVNNNNIWP